MMLVPLNCSYLHNRFRNSGCETLRTRGDDGRGGFAHQLAPPLSVPLDTTKISVKEDGMIFLDPGIPNQKLQLWRESTRVTTQ